MSQRWLPSPRAWANAVALFLFAAGVSLAFAAAMPFVAELLRTSPRLGWLAVLGLWVSPIAAASALHRIVHDILDALEGRRAEGAPSAARRAESAWAGFVAWATILFVTTTTSFVMLVIDPPPVDESAWGYAGLFLHYLGAGAGGLHAAIWVSLAAYVYKLEHGAQRAL